MVSSTDLAKATPTRSNKEKGVAEAWESSRGQEGEAIETDQVRREKGTFA